VAALDSALDPELRAEWVGFAALLQGAPQTTAWHWTLVESDVGLPPIGDGKSTPPPNHCDLWQRALEVAEQAAAAEPVASVVGGALQVATPGALRGPTPAQWLHFSVADTLWHPLRTLTWLAALGHRFHGDRREGAEVMALECLEYASLPEAERGREQQVLDATTVQQGLVAGKVERASQLSTDEVRLPPTLSSYVVHSEWWRAVLTPAVLGVARRHGHDVVESALVGALRFGGRHPWASSAASPMAGQRSLCVLPVVGGPWLEYRRGRHLPEGVPPVDPAWASAQEAFHARAPLSVALSVGRSLGCQGAASLAVLTDWYDHWSRVWSALGDQVVAGDDRVWAPAWWHQWSVDGGRLRT
jgi:hypothetical protein